MSAADTIFAAASAPGRAAIAILRVSGPDARAMLVQLTRRDPPDARRASVRRLLAVGGEPLDTAVVLWLPAPASYTGEDSAELHLHGGAAVLEGVSLALAALGARPAEPGEFTQRAFLNGRMDLTEAEAVADLIEAETEAQRAQALRQMDGELARAFESLGAELKHLLADQEALIDFPDEAAHPAAADAAIAVLIERLTLHLNGAAAAERLREGLVFAVIGPPNVGKSTLVNALVGREAAIVASSPGTTRDVLEVRTVFGGVPVTLLDTAGLRDSDDDVEAEGIRRARRAAAEASLVIEVHQAGSETTIVLDPARLHVASKIDLAPAASGWIGVSVLSGAGLRLLRERLDAAARSLTQRQGAVPLTRSRHRAACVEGLHHLRRARDLAESELRAEELRLAMQAVGRVTGRVGVEDILTSVFSRFCIGK